MGNDFSDITLEFKTGSRTICLGDFKFKMLLKSIDNLKVCLKPDSFYWTHEVRLKYLYMNNALLERK
jgi:hypothetical protein